jgi:hypothetical protein
MSEELGALKAAEKEWEENPSNLTCGLYMEALCEAEAEGLIDDDEWLNGLCAIREWLMP